MKKKEKTANQRIIDSYDYMANAASPQDCTGLIPAAPQDGAQLDAYEEVYHYQPPEIPDPDDPQHTSDF